MGRSGRRQRLALALLAVVGVVAVVSIALASRTGTSGRLEVSAPISGDATSTSASEVTTSDATTVPATTTTSTPTETAPAQRGTSTSTGTDASVLPTSTSAPATRVAPVAPVDGTYFGVEHFALFTGRCAFLDHHIVGTFRPGDGTTWDFHQDYCGTLQGNLWSGVGTFALTAPDGATITGTVTEKDIRVPSPGVPYTLDITAGTQQFAGATGTCRLDNHLHQIHFGLQDDFGAFTCNITVDPERSSNRPV